MSSLREPAYQPYFADPFLTRFGDEFFAYGTGDPARGGASTFEAIHSTDLRHWTSAGPTLQRLDESSGDAYWAPEVVAADDAFWMYFSVGHGITGHHIRVARSDSPLGPFTDQGVNLTPSETFAIDAHPFRDVDGTWYLYFARDVLTGDHPGTHLAVARMTSMTSVEPRVVEILSPDSDWQIYEHNRSMYGRILDWYTLEGPTVIREDDRYHLFFSGGSWEGDGYGVCVASASNPLGPWKHAPAEEASLLNSKKTGLIGPGHNSVLHAGDRKDFIAFHAWNVQRTARQMHIRSLHWIGGAPDLDGV